MPPVQAMVKKRGARRWALPFAALLLVAAVVGPPLISLNGLHHRIAESIGQAIGRPVRMSSIKLRLLPRPGFEIADFVVDEDPAFGAEPILRSSQVVASVRLLPLWRGRLEIARIAFDEPSLNLVRNAQGRWNFDTLLSQAAQIPKAPTAERHLGGLARFPYIDASNARVNFKSGDEKLPFSFFNADLAVWLANPGEWRIQFAAQPVRTDLTLDLANTGLVRLNGSLRHAASLDQMPMDLHAEWSNAPLGQLSKILTGSDADWRGQLNATAEITGSVQNANLKLTASGQSIHRAEFAPREPLDLTVTCQARFHRADRLVDALTCLSPTGSGHLLLTGSVHASPENPDPALSLELNNVPVASALDGIRLVRAGFAPSLAASGEIDGNFTYATPVESDRPQVKGEATVNLLTLVGPSLQKTLALPRLHFSVNSQTPQKTRLIRHALPPATAPAKPALLLEPFVVGNPATSASAAATATLPAAMTVSGAFDRDGFSIHLGGPSHLGELAALGAEFGLPHNPAVDFGAQGNADLDLTIHGPWMLPVSDQPVAPAAIDGTVRLHNTQLSAKFLAQPLRIPAAQAVYSGDRVNWTAPGLTYGPVRADGTLSYPAFCVSATGCVPQFSLHLASLDAATAQIALLGAQQHGEIVERLLGRLRSLNQSSPAWPAVEGTVEIGALTIQELALHDLTASVALEGNTIQLKSSSAQALDGLLQLSGKMEIAGNTPHYEIDAQLERASASATAALFHEKWGPGSIDVRTALKFSGFEQADLLSSAAGSFHWEWSKGGLGGISGLGNTAISESNHRADPVTSVLTHFDTWTADGAIANKSLLLQKSQILKGTEATPIAGSISFGRELELTTSAAPTAGKITGTLERPVSGGASATPPVSATR